jgi:hypothetical protein
MEGSDDDVTAAKSGVPPWLGRGTMKLAQLLADRDADR